VCVCVSVCGCVCVHVCACEILTADCYHTAAAGESDRGQRLLSRTMTFPQSVFEMDNCINNMQTESVCAIQTCRSCSRVNIRLHSHSDGTFINFSHFQTVNET